MPTLYKPCTCILYLNPNPVAFVQRLRLPQTDQDERQTAWTSVTIPYIHGLSQSIHRVLSHLVIRVAFCPFQALRQELVPQGPCSRIAEKGSGLHHPLWPVPLILRQPDWTDSGTALLGASENTEEGECVGLGGCWTCVYIGPADRLVQGQGYGFSPPHPDLVSIGVLAHPTWAGPSQQRKGHPARTLHHSAEVITQPTGIDFPFYDYLAIIINYHCMALYYYSATLLICWLLQPFVFSCSRLRSTSRDL